MHAVPGHILGASGGEHSFQALKSNSAPNREHSNSKSTSSFVTSAQKKRQRPNNAITAISKVHQYASACLGNLGVASELAGSLDRPLGRRLRDVPHAHYLVVGCAQQLAFIIRVPGQPVSAAIKGNEWGCSNKRKIMERSNYHFL
jgi:hypothetical protein